MKRLTFDLSEHFYQPAACEARSQLVLRLLTFSMSVCLYTCIWYDVSTALMCPTVMSRTSLLYNVILVDLMAALSTSVATMSSLAQV